MRKFHMKKSMTQVKSIEKKIISFIALKLNMNFTREFAEIKP